MQESGRDRRIDPAGKPAHDPADSDLMADALDRLGAEGRHRPVAMNAADMVGEIAQQLAALRGVHNFGMEQHAVEPPVVIGDRREWRTVAYRHRAQARRQGIDLVAMTHPHLLARALGP